jgi:hypothetical protein
MKAKSPEIHVPNYTATSTIKYYNPQHLPACQHYAVPISIFNLFYGFMPQQ